jgi:hypothetical protein
LFLFIYLICFLSSLSRKSIRESALSSTTTGGGGAIGNNMSTMGGSMASASASYRRPATDLNNTNDEAGITTNDTLAIGGAGGDTKPRSLRFTWSMKTTSSMDPADMMKEIRKVNSNALFHRKLCHFFFY